MRRRRGKETGAAALLLSVAVILGLLGSLTVLQTKSRRFSKEQSQRFDSLEGFYAAEVAAQHALFLDTASLTPTGAADSRGRFPASLSSLSPQWTSYSAGHTSTTQPTNYDPAQYQSGTPLNYALTKKYLSGDKVIRRYEDGKLRLKPKSGTDPRLCGEISFRSSSDIFKVCLVSRTPAAEYVKLTYKAKHTWGYLSNGLDIAALYGGQALLTGEGAGSWGMWGFLVSIPDVPVVQGPTTNYRNSKYCNDDELPIGSTGHYEYGMRCVKMLPGFKLEDKTNHVVPWNIGTSQSCPADKVIVAHTSGPANYKVGFTCARIRKP